MGDHLLLLLAARRRARPFSVSPALLWLSTNPPPTPIAPAAAHAPCIHHHRPTTQQAHIWQLDFALSPQALRELNMQLRINEDVLRHAVVKRQLPKLPLPHALYHRLSEHAAQLRPPPRPGQRDYVSTPPQQQHANS
jgi:hypothetical protein